MSSNGWNFNLCMHILQYDTKKQNYPAGLIEKRCWKRRLKQRWQLSDWCFCKKSASCNTFKTLPRLFIQYFMLNNQRIKVQVGLFQGFTERILTFKHKFLVVLPLTWTIRHLGRPFSATAGAKVHSCCHISSLLFPPAVFSCLQSDNPFLQKRCKSHPHSTSHLRIGLQHSRRQTLC